MHLVQRVHAVLLSGGSAFGLDSASGVVRYLEERGVGFNVGVARVPIVPAAILFDLSIGNPNIRPDAQMGYQACLNATNDPPLEGNVGAGTGATVGKVLGIDQAMKSGVGNACIDIGNGTLVGAIAAVNAFGDIIDPNSGEIIAGSRSMQRDQTITEKNEYFTNTMKTLKTQAGRTILGFASRRNTVIGIVATNAELDKEGINKVTQMAHDGLARTVRPAHTMFDGDTIFGLSIGKHSADMNIVGAYAAEAFSQAILQAVRTASPAAGLPTASSRI
jgi:L-aminopeptidase/D-esterase-like protein